MYLFDTDAITNIFKKAPSPYLLRRLEEIAPQQQSTTTITVAEIVYGARKSTRPDYHLKNLEELLLPRVTILDFDLEAAFIAGDIRAHLEKKGRRLAWADIQIGAIALLHEATVITGNVRHFSRIPGLRIENWISA